MLLFTIFFLQFVNFFRFVEKLYFQSFYSFLNCLSAVVGLVDLFLHRFFILGKVLDLIFQISGILIEHLLKHVILFLILVKVTFHIVLFVFVYHILVFSVFFSHKLNLYAHFLVLVNYLLQFIPHLSLFYCLFLQLPLFLLSHLQNLFGKFLFLSFEFLPESHLDIAELFLEFLLLRLRLFDFSF